MLFLIKNEMQQRRTVQMCTFEDANIEKKIIISIFFSHFSLTDLTY